MPFSSYCVLHYLPSRRTLRINAVLLCVLLLSGCSSEPEGTTQAPKVVDTYLINDQPSAAITQLSGRVAAAEKTTLSFEVPGKIETLDIDVGEAFIAGEPLVQLDKQRYRLVLGQREAQQREAAAALTEKRQDYQRHTTLAEKGYVSQARLDTVKAALDSARSRQQSAAAALELARRDLNLTTLTAPYDGSVSQRLAEPSERVSANQPVLEIISDRQGFDVEGSVPETLVDLLTTGSRHTVTLPALSDAEYDATLRHLGSQPRSSNDYPLILHLANPPKGIRSGMTAEIQLTMLDTGHPRGVQLPMTALVYDENKRHHVLKVTDAMTLEAVPVEVITLGEKQVEVSGELASGERIVARGTEFVRPGQTVSLLGQGPKRFN
ncbi:efflux RND transporter periplasmic adaptor subunit [Halomonas halocynthiae]|uniref:efflux RND transporter periplasmic adaptor subunit n=1 Tax=Halomonas halocynthiae TaxID=176290 RepID=UPI000A00D9D0|nr:efflux RND transporter periplasmic adaptor subunit [Halomonas halocynthiae]